MYKYYSRCNKLDKCSRQGRCEGVVIVLLTMFALLTLASASIVFYKLAHIAKSISFILWLNSVFA